ncbi:MULTISPECIES: hypothetical protein [unclassified Bartonella]|uniref:hypothetical protein n=1 Tax=unclassified Bartonella TaxID=2645622 RepID=UPI0035D0DFCC
MRASLPLFSCQWSRNFLACQWAWLSLKPSEMAVLMFVCQEHGKWHLEKRRKAEKRKGVQEGWGGYACEGVVHAGVLLGCVLGCGCGGCLWGSLRGENAFVMRAKWSMLSRFAV